MGLLKEGFDISEKDVNDLVRKSAQRLSEKGAVVEDVSIPWHLDGNLEFIQYYQSGSNVAWQKRVLMYPNNTYYNVHIFFRTLFALRYFVIQFFCPF